MNKEVKPTWNYILNDLALYSLFMRVAYSEDVPKQDKVDLEHQIKLLQQENEQLQQKVKHLEANWDELKGWLKANDIHYAEAIPFRETLNKMQELERGKEDV